MKEDEFRASLSNAVPPTNASPALCALWWQRNGNWARAHSIAQSDSGEDTAWAHALLHREEGDLANAAYWYGRAKQEPSRMPVDEEWDQIVSKICSTP